jgi:hypothetical protein
VDAAEKVDKVRVSRMRQVGVAPEAAEDQRTAMTDRRGAELCGWAHRIEAEKLVEKEL